MPYQGPRSECNHCNNNMLATHKHNASALFWYTQRYHRPRTVEHGAAAGVTAANPYSSPAGPWTGPPYPRAPRLGPRAFSISLVNSFGVNFVWQLQLYSRTNFKLNRAAALAERLLFLSSIRTCGITKWIRGEQKPFAASA